MDLQLRVVLERQANPLPRNSASRTSLMSSSCVISGPDRTHTRENSREEAAVFPVVAALRQRRCSGQEENPAMLRLAEVRMALLEAQRV
ncbi:hypothetical protein CRENBAI_025357 [Crenichthys baileyi]|uniref:Uncharacterized protein n=1 Tax=Crenichthys baileyi TaxID=28760 RepID=A0AAV9RP91_9TELE